MTKSYDTSRSKGRNQTSAHKFGPFLKISALLIVVPKVNVDKNEWHEIKEDIQDEKKYFVSNACRFRTINSNRNTTFSNIKNLNKKDNKTEFSSFDDEILSRVDLIQLDQSLYVTHVFAQKVYVIHEKRKRKR